MITSVARQLAKFRGKIKILRSLMSLSKRLVSLSNALVKLPLVVIDVAAVRSASTSAAAVSIIDLPDTHQMLKETCRNFTETVLKPVAAEIDRTHKYPEKEVG